MVIGANVDAGGARSVGVGMGVAIGAWWSVGGQIHHCRA